MIFRKWYPHTTHKIDPRHQIVAEIANEDVKGKEYEKKRLVHIEKKRSARAKRAQNYVKVVKPKGDYLA